MDLAVELKSAIAKGGKGGQKNIQMVVECPGVMGKRRGEVRKSGRGAYRGGSREGVHSTA